MRQNNLLVAVVGCTAAGKTTLAIDLAQQLNGEIVGADSRQVYRYMDIGTAKPTAEERALVPHHLVDFVDPAEDFSLARYQDLANATIADCMARGRVPLLVGGTGQYVQAILQGWRVPRVSPQPALRARLAALADAEGPEVLHARLREIDPAAATAIGPRNARRLIRALEVYEVTGTPISAQQEKVPPPYTIVTCWLDWQREALYERIDLRVDQMIEAGLVDEVRDLRERGYGWELSSMASLGYKEFRPLLEGRASLAECVQTLKWNTHAFARRQEAWFKRLPHLHRIPAGPRALDDVLTLVARGVA
jgi:tRNA dimethylallyltransferase